MPIAALLCRSSGFGRDEGLFRVWEAHHECVEPAPRLVKPLRDELGWKALLELLRVTQQRRLLTLRRNP